MAKVNKAEAGEWLGSLQQIGQGWYINCALAVKVGAPQALGMTAREFAQAIGQHLINPDDAIVELYDQKHPMNRIATVLGIGTRRVEFVLAKAGKIAITPSRQRMLDANSPDVDAPHISERRDSSARMDSDADDSSARTDSELDKLRKRVDKLAADNKAITEAADDDRYQLQQDVNKLRKQNRVMAKQMEDAMRTAREEVWQQMTDQERERAAKESQAWAQAQADSILSGLAGGYARNVVSALGEASESLRELIQHGHGVSKDQLADIEAAHAGFIEEMNRARMAELST